MSYVFTANESEADRITNVAIARLNTEERAALEKSKQKFQAGQALGGVLVDVFKGLF
jgi:hypothetical protein